MERPNLATEPLVPPVLDRAELMGNARADLAVLEAEPEEALLLRQHHGRGVAIPTPAPQHLPPPAPPAPAPPEVSLSGDSLSMAQLQSLVRGGQARAEPTPYAFAYDDAARFEEELDEWFSYTAEEQALLQHTHAAFSRAWPAFHAPSTAPDWEAATDAQQTAFLRNLLAACAHDDPEIRRPMLGALLYLLLGCWHETAGLPHASPSLPADEGDRHTAYHAAGRQASLIKRNVRLLHANNGVPVIVNALCLLLATAGNAGVDAHTVAEAATQDTIEAEKREIWCAMTAVYVILEVARCEERTEADLTLRTAILELDKPGLLMVLVDVVAKLRWDESISLPLYKIVLLLWKTLLVTLGGLAEVTRAKDFVKEDSLETADEKGHPLITASPLDYHLFRQEISSKYPAYNPPPPLFPLEPENNSILPPLKNHPNRVAGNHVFGSGLGDSSSNSTSILHQPVHIATPAPSPPPSPAGPGGKGGKKQNYQTNQMFPFLYPPLDESSNKLGGKGSTDLQDVLVGRKWEGADIPASILEAAELFSQRMKATRAMKQLWQERVAFMKYERGWTGPEDDLDINPLSLDPKQEDAQPFSFPPGSVEERMALVEAFYRNSLHNLQSLIIVLIKAILAHVTALVTQSSGANGLQSSFQFQENQNGTASRPDMEGSNGHSTSSVATNEELDAIRTQEILDKAVTGTLILILKWFKVSHVLKFEYITQLLVDSSYVPLILKLLQLQEIEKLVNVKSEQEELNFFHYCHAHSRNALVDEDSSHRDDNGRSGDSDEDEEDNAVPPPIRLSRVDANDSNGDSSPPPPPLQPPEVDELGFPTNELPKEPITNFSWRTFFTSINYLRIMQKVCKNKAHRNLMLVSYKSSQFLRKSLKVPQPELRLYTLKLFKNQVPYCGRKWRQSNMRVITAVYLHCRPELRDDWLAGSDVDAEVDESVPLEQALRSLTHWHNLKRYPESLGAKPGVLQEEQDFFRNELDKMDWGDEVPADGDMEHGWQDLQAEGW